MDANDAIVEADEVDEEGSAAEADEEGDCWTTADLSALESLLVPPLPADGVLGVLVSDGVPAPLPASPSSAVSSALATLPRFPAFGSGFVFVSALFLTSVFWSSSSSSVAVEPPLDCLDFFVGGGGGRGGAVVAGDSGSANEAPGRLRRDLAPRPAAPASDAVLAAAVLAAAFFPVDAASAGASSFVSVSMGTTTSSVSCCNIACSASNESFSPS